MAAESPQSKLASESEALSGPRLRVPWLLLLVGLAGAIVYAVLHGQSFPTAALDLKLNREGAEARSAAFLRELGHDVRGYRRSTYFWSDYDALVYLDKTLGTAQANRWLRSGDIPVWAWCTRYFVPLRAEEYSVYWSPDGTLIGFEFHVPDDQAMPSLEPAPARGQAERALARWFPQLRDRVQFASSADETRPHRIDRSFDWKVVGNPAELRRYVTVGFSGTMLTSLMSSIGPPEAFARHETNIASRRALLQGVFDALNSFLELAVCLLILLAWERRWLRWGPGAAIAGLLLIVELLSAINQLPLAWVDYSTQDPVSAFWIARLRALLDLPTGAVWAMIVFVSADAVGRLFPRSAYSLGDIVRRPLHGTSTFRTATLAGIGAAGIQLGFVTLFYTLGHRRLGFYSPIDVPYDSLLSTSIPWIQPLLIGLSAAFNEEALYRLLAIPLLLYWLKRPWLAVLIPAVLWGFLHTSYHVEPIYVRGVELTMVGVFLGLVFLRYGIWATIVSHCMYNATVCSAPLLASASPYLIASSIAVILAIIVPAIGPRSRSAFEFARLHGGPASIPQATIERRCSEPAAALNLWIPVALGALFLVAALCIPIRWWLPTQQLNAVQAQETAKQQLGRLGYSLQGYMGTADLRTYTASPDVETYLRGALPRRLWLWFLDRFSPEQVQWAIRFVAPGRPQEYSVGLDPHGELCSLSCTEADTMALQTLSAELSRKRAETFLCANGVDTVGLQYGGLQEFSYPARKDVRHVWVDSSVSIGDLRRQIVVDVRGDRIAGFETALELPESFLRNQHSASSWGEIQTGLDTILVVVVCLLVLRSLFSREVLRPLFSRGALAVGVSLGMAAALRTANGWQSIWLSYDTSEAASVFVARKILEVTNDVVGMFVAGYVVSLLFVRLAPKAFAQAPTSDELRAWIRTPPWRWHGARTGFAWALTIVLANIAIARLVGWLNGGRSSDAFSAELGGFTAAFPPLILWLNVLQQIFLFLTFGALIAALRVHAPRWLLFVLLGLFVASTTTIDFTEPWRAIVSAVSSTLLWVAVLSLIRFRLAFYGWYALLTASVPFVPWLISGSGSFRSTATVALIPVVLMTVLLFSRFRRRGQLTGAGSSPR